MALPRPDFRKADALRAANRRFEPVPKYSEREKLAFAVSHARQRAEILKGLKA